jgi:hypothetical protein
MQAASGSAGKSTASKTIDLRNVFMVMGNVEGGGKNECAPLKPISTSVSETQSKLYHYTSADPTTIVREGLVPGASKKVFTTPAGKLSPQQAQIDLALPPNRGLPQHLIEIDVTTLQKMGIEIPDATLVGRKFNMPGGGMEVIFPQKLPAEAMKVIR